MMQYSTALHEYAHTMRGSHSGGLVMKSPRHPLFQQLYILDIFMAMLRFYGFIPRWHLSTVYASWDSYGQTQVSKLERCP